MKLFISGGRGRLGSKIVDYLKDRYTVLYPGRKELDLTFFQKVMAYFIEEKPDIIIHTAAFTNVDKCEEDRDRAYRENILATLYLKNAAEYLNIPLVYFSTDYVFDGLKTTPYREYDKTVPVNYYGTTKLAGEEIVKTLKDFVILRVSLLFGSGNDFITYVLKSILSDKEITVFTDHIGSPTNILDIAKALDIILNNFLSGIYHLVNRGAFSYIDIVNICESILKKKALIRFSERNGAKRPYYTPLSTELIENVFGITMKNSGEAIEDYISSYIKD